MAVVCLKLVYIFTLIYWIGSYKCIDYITCYRVHNWFIIGLPL